jgi:4,5-DOPA dioxygenase extradiol
VGQKLAPLRKEGVMIMGSGNVVHNLRQMRFGKSNDARNGDVADWNKRFNTDIRNQMVAKDWPGLINAVRHPDYKMCNPSHDHFFPIYVVAGAVSERD